MPSVRCATYFAGVVGILTTVLFSTNAPKPSANDTSITMAPTVSLLPTANATIPGETITITTTAVIEITASPAAFAPSSASVPLSASATTNAKVRFNGLLMPRMSTMDQRRYKAATTFVMIFGALLMSFLYQPPKLEMTSDQPNRLPIDRLQIDRLRAAIKAPALKISEVYTCFEYKPNAPVAAAPASVPPTPRSAAALPPPPEDSSAVIAAFTSERPRVALPGMALPRVVLPPPAVPSAVAPHANRPILNAAAPTFNPFNPASGIPRFAGGRGRTQDPEEQTRRLEETASRYRDQYAAFQAQHPKHGLRHH